MNHLLTESKPIDRIEYLQRQSTRHVGEKFTRNNVQYTVRFMDNSHAVIHSDKYGEETITIERLNQLI